MDDGERAGRGTGGGLRLSPDEIDAIKSAAAQAFGPDAVVRLFGSRVDNSRRGGDIDLLFEVEPEVATTSHEARFLDALFARVDEQKVDKVFVARGEDPGPFAGLVTREAVPLP